jgi:hypothetical protein
MRNFISQFITIFCLAGMASCASAGQTYTWQDIKQEVGPTVPKPAKEAYLKVYTKEEEVNDGGYLWVRGLRYNILSADGKIIESVRNDNTPDTFALLPGKYVIVPLERQYKNEIIGAILEPGKLTEVHMMGG